MSAHCQVTAGVLSPPGRFFSRSAKPWLLLPLLLALLPAGLSAHSYDTGSLNLLHPYLAPTPPGARVAAGYVVISNQGQQPERLLGGSAPFAGRIEVHSSSLENGVAKMRELEQGLALPVGETVVLMPGKTHLMFVDLTEQLMRGERYSVTLEFERYGTLDLEFLVEDVAGHDVMDHSTMQHSD